ncbi:hypothetical protein Ndes2437B_g06815 [Nannochloris sp. 'desiccata']
MTLAALPRPGPCPRRSPPTALCHARLPSLRFRAHGTESQYSKVCQQHASLAYFNGLAKTLHSRKKGCTQAEADLMALWCLSSDDFKNAPVMEVIDIYILIMEYGMYGNARKAALKMLNAFREMDKEWTPSTTFIALPLPIAARLCKSSCKVLSHALETRRAFSSIEKICELRDYLFRNLKTHINMILSNQMMTDKERKAAVGALNVFYTGNYCEFSKEQIAKYVSGYFATEKKRVARGFRRSILQFTSPTTMENYLTNLLQKPRFESNLDKNASFGGQMSHAVVYRIKYGPLETIGALQNMLHLVTDLVKDVGTSMLAALPEADKMVRKMSQIDCRKIPVGYLAAVGDNILKFRALRAAYPSFARVDHFICVVLKIWRRAVIENKTKVLARSDFNKIMDIESQIRSVKPGLGAEPPRTYPAGKVYSFSKWKKEWEKEMAQGNAIPFKISETARKDSRKRGSKKVAAE